MTNHMQEELYSCWLRGMGFDIAYRSVFGSTTVYWEEASTMWCAWEDSFEYVDNGY